MERTGDADPVLTGGIGKGGEKSGMGRAVDLMRDGATMRGGRMRGTMMQDLTQSSTIRLWELAPGTQCVIDDHGDRGVFTIEQVMQLVREAELRRLGQDRIHGAFRHVLGRLSAWIVSHHRSIREAYLTDRDSSLLFLVVAEGQAYDEAIHDALIAVDVDLANDPAAAPFHLSTLLMPGSVPKDAPLAFLSRNLRMHHRKG